MPPLPLVARVASARRRRVGPAGSALATDIAAEMPKIAAEAAHQAGLRAQARDHRVERRGVHVELLGVRLMFHRDMRGRVPAH